MGVAWQHPRALRRFHAQFLRRMALSCFKKCVDSRLIRGAIHVGTRNTSRRPQAQGRLDEHWGKQLHRSMRVQVLAGVFHCWTNDGRRSDGWQVMMHKCL